MASKSEVLDFLKEFKAQAATGGMVFVPRRRNREDLDRLGLSVRDAKAMILGLTERDYCRGPETDEDGSAGEIWFFGESFNGSAIYIKLKLDDTAAKCISFHCADYPMRFPYR